MINNELTTKRKYELEQTIESNNDEFIEIDKSLSLSELIYLVEAFKMPYLKYWILLMIMILKDIMQ